MKFDFKHIHIGSLIQMKVKENNLDSTRICNFLRCSENDIDLMYQTKSLDAELLLRWSKLLEYDLFRIYSQHLILFAPSGKKQDENSTSMLPKFRKNIYTKDIIDFVLEQINKKEKTRLQIIEEYRIPKTTLHKWIEKYKV